MQRRKRLTLINTVVTVLGGLCAVLSITLNNNGFYVLAIVCLIASCALLVKVYRA